MSKTDILRQAVDPTLDETPWSRLTRMPEKARLYARDPFFRAALAAAASTPDWADRLHRRALVLIKPDGVFGQLQGQIVAMIVEAGFRLAWTQPIPMPDLRWREMWRYQLTSATLDRLAVNELVMSGDALLVLMDGPTAEPMPAALRFSQLKGSSDPALQPPDSLRRRLGLGNRVLSCLHGADEPADVLRELAILLAPVDLAHALAATADPELQIPAPPPAPPRNLDPVTAMERLTSALDGAAGGSSQALSQAADALDRVRRGERIAWRPFVRALSASGARTDPWDLAVFGSIAIVYDEPGHPKQIGSPAPGLWDAPDAFAHNETVALGYQPS